jgi:hypothetical protein
MGSIFFVVGIDLYQQRKTEHALEALRDLSSPAQWLFKVLFPPDTGLPSIG